MSRGMKNSFGIIMATVAILLLSGSAFADLVDHYEFEDNGYDSAGGDANGNVGANVTFEAGEIGLSAVFGISAMGNENLIDVPIAVAFNPGYGDFTFAFWVKRNQADMDGVDAIFDALMTTGIGWQCFFSASTELDHIKFRLDDDLDNVAFILSENPMPDTTQFHHYALTVDRTNHEALLYIDGVADPVVDISHLIGSIYPEQNIQIGGMNDNPAFGLDGQLDDLRFYNHKLEESEVLALFNQQGVEGSEYGSEAVPALLHQAQPNPCVQSASIGFTINQPGNVELSLYNIAGRKIATLVEGAYQPGEYSAIVNDLSSGIYIYRITTGEFNDSMMMVVVK